MATFRRLHLFSWLFAVLVSASSAAPPLAVWQCRHASRIVSAAALLSAMPCRTTSMPMPEGSTGSMPRMACCLPKTAASSAASAHSAAITHPACHPTVTRLAVLPPGSVSETHTPLSRSLAAAFLALPETAPFLPPFLQVLPLRQRPPPTLGFSSPALKHVPGLRAPPAA